jgi:hypothetical protein
VISSEGVSKQADISPYLTVSFLPSFLPCTMLTALRQKGEEGWGREKGKNNNIVEAQT